MAVTLVEATDTDRNDPDWPVCPWGHRQSPDNVVFAKQGTDGRERARCRLCRNASVQRHRERARGGDVPLLKAFSPHRAPKTVEPSPAPTASLFSMLPPDFRQRLAGELMAREANPLQITYLKRASEERAWTGTSPDYAIALYVQALIDLTVDARSEQLRLDRLLRLVLGD